MSTRIAINAYKAAYIMLESGLKLEEVKTALSSVSQPVKGYYYIGDVNKHIERVKK